MKGTSPQVVLNVCSKSLYSYLSSIQFTETMNVGLTS